MIGDRKRIFTNSSGLGMKIELDPAQVSGKWPEDWILKSDKRYKNRSKIAKYTHVKIPTNRTYPNTRRADKAE